MVILFAIGCAVAQGAADFYGGRSARKTSITWVLVLSKVAGLPALAWALIVLGGRPHSMDLLWGGFAGFFGMASLGLLYRGLAAGSVALVAPVSAATSALVPFVTGLAATTRPQPGAAVGALCAIIAAALVSTGKAGDGGLSRPRLICLAVSSGCGFGLFFIFLHRAAVDGGIWSLAVAHFTALGLAAGWLLMRSRRSGFVVARALPGSTVTMHRLSNRSVGCAALAGVLDVSANTFYVLAARGGLLGIVAPIASLYPTSTILLALAVDRERIRPLQCIGLSLVGIALILVA
jgi:uncharacterized membrane protein